jgi:hypothetical protein
MPPCLLPSGRRPQQHCGPSQQESQQRGRGSSPSQCSPEGAPHWDGRVTIIPKHEDWDYAAVSELITSSCHMSLSINIYCDAVLSNRNRDNGKQLSAAAATLYQEGRESRHAERVYGDAVTVADAQIRALTPALDAITTHLNNKPVHLQETFTVLFTSNTALCRMLDPTTHKEQAVSLGHLRKIDELLTAYPNIDILLQWLPRKIHFAGF